MQPTDRQSLLAWFDRHKRDLPWRRTKDAYAIWVSEIMLQQTQVATVIPYWHRWMQRFPTVEDLAATDESQVLAAWQGLGYYRRGRMLLEGARYVASNGLPITAKDWLQVPGVGRYTAGAIASIASQEPTSLVDGNVERVYARQTLDESTGTKLTKAAWAWAESELERDRPGDWNQALMELGATICRPTSPLCPECPIQTSCQAFATGRTADLPRKAPKPKPVDLEFTVLIPISNSGRFGLRQIPAGQWWAGMWEFPREANKDDLPWRGDPLGVVKHQVTHHRIRLYVEIAQDLEETKDLRWFEHGELEHLALPAPQRKALALVTQQSLFLQYDAPNPHSKDRKLPE